MHKNYRYGDKAIVKLSLLCEYIIDRTAYDLIKPKSVKMVLGQVEVQEESYAEEVYEVDSSYDDEF